MLRTNWLPPSCWTGWWVQSVWSRRGHHLAQAPEGPETTASMASWHAAPLHSQASGWQFLEFCPNPPTAHYALHYGPPSSWAVRRERRGGGQGQAWAEGPSCPKGQQQRTEWPSRESWDSRRDHESCPTSSGLPSRWAP